MKNKIILANAFSLSMVSGNCKIEVREISHLEVLTILHPDGEWQSCIGHADTSKILEGLLGQSVQVNRSSICVEEGDILVVAQYSGGRLPEGATELPEGAKILWKMVRVV